MKKMIKCELGHKYDKKKHSNCPYCGVNIDLSIVRAFVQSNNRVKRNSMTLEEYNATVLSFESDATVIHNETIVHFEQKEVIKGWIVCVLGNEKNADYQIREGENKYILSDGKFINDITFDSDHEVCFIINVQDKKEMNLSINNNSEIYINDVRVIHETSIVTGDRISFYNREFVVQQFSEGWR